MRRISQLNLEGHGSFFTGIAATTSKGTRPVATEEEPMEELLATEALTCQPKSELLESSEEVKKLAVLIERAIDRLTNRGVRDLKVEVSRHGILLRGRCHSYYVKQLAQHAAMSVRGGHRLVNCIEVC